MAPRIDPLRARSTRPQRGRSMPNRLDGQYTPASVRDLQWVRRAREVEDFLARHPESHLPPALANWVRYQRRRNSFPDWQLAQLDSIGGFVWEPRYEAWCDRHDQVVEFIQRHDRAPRRRSPDPHERSLGHWVSYQLQQHRTGKLPYGRVERLRRLEARVVAASCSGPKGLLCPLSRT